MSYLVNKEIPCQHCQFPNEVEVWSIVNVKEDPELRDLLLGGEFNMTECTACRKIFYAEHFVLYHDPDLQFMAFVYPYEDRANRAEFEKRTRENFEQYQMSDAQGGPLTYSPATLFGLDELVALVEWEEDARIQSEIATHLLDPKKYQFKTLKPSFFRQHRLPPLLPFPKNQPVHNDENLLMALRSVLQANERLAIYANAESYLLEHPQLTLEFADSHA